MLTVELYLSLLILPAILGMIVSVIPSKKGIAGNVGLLLCVISSIVGTLTYFVIGDSSYEFIVPSVVGSYYVMFDQFTRMIISISSLVFLMSVIHLARFGALNKEKYVGLTNLLFISCILAMSADCVILLLVAWELISLTTFLMSYGANETARWRYFTITHMGGLLLMGVFAAMWSVSGTYVLSEMGEISSIAGSMVSSVMIFLLFIGFGTKLGILPFHAWMPDLYAGAPIHTVTFLSTVCSNVAIMILVKGIFLWIGVPNNMYLIVLMLLLSSTTAIWGAMESLIQTEPRRILAYSSMENMALVTMCISAAMLFSQISSESLMAVMIVAAILHTVNHSLFKSLMLMTVGTVEDCTGEHAIEKMGGLAKVIPMISVFALIGVLAMAAIPPLNGFVSEWLIIKTMISADVEESILRLVIPLVVAALGVCGMMAAVSYARLYGFMFLGRPRSEMVAKPKPIDKTTMFPLAILALFCIGFGVFAAPLVNELMDALCGLLGIIRDPSVDILSGSLDPLVLSAILLTIAIVMLLFSRVFKKKVKRSTTWDCGVELEEQMQYSSIGFTQPLVRVFHPFYGDKTAYTDDNEERGTYKVRFAEPFTEYFFRPLGRSVYWVAEKIGKIQTGNIQSYLGYILFTLLFVLLGARLIC